MKEIWKDINGYEGLYLVSNFGRIKSLPKKIKMRSWETIITPERIINGTDRDGYWRIRLCNKGKWKQIFTHRLVAEAFIDNPDNKPQVNHKDGNRKNNNVNNLEWMTHEENQLYSWTNCCRSYKLSIPQVIKIRNSKLSTKELQKIFNVSRTTINNIKSGKSWLFC